MREGEGSEKIERKVKIKEEKKRTLQQSVLLYSFHTNTQTLFTCLGRKVGSREQEERETMVKEKI